LGVEENGERFKGREWGLKASLFGFEGLFVEFQQEICVVGEGGSKR
jgi:hypothetical protein